MQKVVIFSKKVNKFNEKNIFKKNGNICNINDKEKNLKTKMTNSFFTVIISLCLTKKSKLKKYENSQQKCTYLRNIFLLNEKRRRRKN